MLRWPRREVLEAYVVVLKDEAAENQRIRNLAYVIEQVNSTKRIQPPEVPDILKE